MISTSGHSGSRQQRHGLFQNGWIDCSSFRPSSMTVWLTDLTEWQAPMQLLSRGDSLARLEASTLEHFENVWILDDTAEPEPGDVEEDVTEEVELAAATSAPPEIPLVGLHAKLYVADEGWNARVFTGSANATRAAFNRNVEFLVELRGKKSRCGVAAMLGHSEDNGKKQASCLADLLQPYIRCEGQEGVNEDVDRFERLVDELGQGSCCDGTNR